ncbi:MAG: hypothetical protein WCV73_05150 [Patescibacteria group bacterium]|jgi:diadenosine tetraphosphate (Ap4A) HIT family hydrolase
MIKTKEMVDYKGNVEKIACLACAREQGEINSGEIARSKYFDAHQDCFVPIPGLVIISARRHIQSFAEFTDREQRDFIKFLCRTRLAMKQALGVKVIYLYHREDTEHHFHLCLLPRHGWMKKFGTKTESVRPIINYAKKKFKTRNDIMKVEAATEKLKQFLK